MSHYIGNLPQIFLDDLERMVKEHIAAVHARVYEHIELPDYRPMEGHFPGKVLTPHQARRAYYNLVAAMRK
jgi:hypothetical protein